MIIDWEASDYKMLKYTHQNFNLARVIFATPVFSKFLTEVAQQVRNIETLIQLRFNIKTLYQKCVPAGRSAHVQE